MRRAFLYKKDKAFLAEETDKEVYEKGAKTFLSLFKEVAKEDAKEVVEEVAEEVVCLGSLVLEEMVMFEATLVLLGAGRGGADKCVVADV